MWNNKKFLVFLLLSTLSYVNSDNITQTCASEIGPWSCLLEEWATGVPSEVNGRQARILALPSGGYYVTDRVDLVPPPPGPRPYDEWQMPPPTGPGKILNKPTNPYKEKPFKPSVPYKPEQLNQQLQQPQQFQQNSQQLQQNPQQLQQNPQQFQLNSQQLQQNPQQLQQNPQQLHQNPQQFQQNTQQFQQNPQQFQQKPPKFQQLPQKYPTSGRPIPPGPPRPGHPAPAAADRVDPAPPRREVSETDLYLLGAIEKLVYRVDLMEKRLRKMEESVHYLVAGKDKAPEPCVESFTRVGAACYHFSPEPHDWKSANLACRKLRSHLLEIDNKHEKRQLMAAVHADKKIRELDFWTGGLNPGLLWIWSSSARPVAGNSTEAGASGAGDVTVVGEGRCLALVYDPAIKEHVYRGQDCAFRHRFVCEKTEDKATLSNEIERVSRTLRLVEGARRSKVLWTDEH